jgi:hypothetical protein
MKETAPIDNKIILGAMVQRVSKRLSWTIRRPREVFNTQCGTFILRAAKYSASVANRLDCQALTG